MSDWKKRNEDWRDEDELEEEEECECPWVDSKGKGDILENFENVILLSCDLPERYRIWSSTMEYFLIHIDPDSGNTLTDIAPHQIIFDQHPTYFFVFPVDIIRPFDGKIVSIAI